jgi:hypothetical protein
MPLDCIISTDNQDTGLTPPHACACTKPWQWFPTTYIMAFFCVQCVEVIGHCLFCWYSFHAAGMQVNNGIYHNISSDKQ